MKRYLTRRTLALTGVLLATQLLSACIILPRPFHHRHPLVVIDGNAGHDGYSQGAYRGRRH